MIHRPFVAELQRGAALLRLPTRLISPLHVRPGDCVYSVILKPDLSKTENRGQAEALKPFTTVYASPLPFNAWGRLVKARFTTGPGPGTTWNLCVGLSEADLYARSFQTSEHHSLAAPSSEGQGPVVVPDTEVVLEVPDKAFLDKRGSDPAAEENRTPYRVAEENIELHTLLHTLLSDDPRRDTEKYQGDVSTCINVLNSRLKKRSDDDKRFTISVDSLAPLSALSALSRHGPATKLVLERCQDSKDDAWLPCEQWQRTLWPESRSSAEGAGGSPVVVLSSVNADEKLLTLHFFDLHDQLLTAFDLVVPSAGLEHRWWQWIYDEIRCCQGSVLSSHSTARFEGRWSALSVVAAYPAVRSDKDIERWSDVPTTDIGRVLTSFRNLQGHAARLRSIQANGSEDDSFRSLAGEVGTKALGSQSDKYISVTKPDEGWLRARVAHHCLGDALAREQLIQSPRLDSTLKNVRVWYRKPVEASSRYTSRFGRNPFSFTRPLSLNDYSALYVSFEKMRELDSRARLADRLAAHLCSAHSENIVLVGAYRSGKTTIMNMVVDLINQGDLGSPVIAVRINTAVTPPEQLFLAVYQEILNLPRKSWTSDSPKAKAVEWVRNAGATIANSFHDVFKSNASLELEFAIPFLKSLKLATADTVDTELEYIREMQQRGGHEAMSKMELTARRAARLRASVTLLKKLLRDAAQEGKDFKVVIALDEVADASAWGTNWAFPAWRQLIEDPGLPEARWLFSSTRPLAVSTGYAPLGNAMREYNMEPLRDVEAEAFLNAFDSFEPKWWDSADVSGKARLRPVVTFHARKRIIWLAGNQPYLMQVVCCHLFDECIKNGVPILTSGLVREVVEGRILPELSDFFLGQWQTLDSEHATAILNAVGDTASRLNLWRHCPDDRTVRFKCSPEVQKSLERAGLGSQRLPMVFVPLFVMWIQEHFATARAGRA